MKTKRTIFVICLAWALLVIAAQQFHFSARPLQELVRPLLEQELAAVDYRFRLRGTQTPPEEVVIVAIDERSINRLFDDEVGDPMLAALRTFPFPRRVYASAIEKLSAAGAKVVALDLLFSTPKEDDPLLQAAIARHRDRVVLASNFSDDGWKLSLPSPVVPEGIPTKSLTGFVNFWPDADGAVRRARYRATTFATGDEEWRSFAAHAAGRTLPDGLIDFVGPRGTFPSYPIYELFHAKTWERNLKSGEVFRDKIVLIGPMDNFQHDQHPTPFGDMEGVEIHANAVATLLRGVAPREVSRVFDVMAVMLLALATAAILQWFSHPVLKIVALALLGAAYFALAVAVFREGHWVVTVAGPLWTVAGGGVFGIAAQLLAEQLERRRVRQTLEKYVSKPVADEILRRGEEYQQSLRGERRAVTILFSDIRGFTTLSEQADPAKFVEQLNEYFTVMVEIVMKHDGTLSKFIGDAIMALYGAPLSKGDREDAWNAVATAYEMRERLAELQKQWAAQGRPALTIGIGINYGDVILGDIGSPQRMEYTVIGDPVNVASRVEGLNKEFGTDILLTEAVYELVKDRVVVTEAGQTTVKGRAQPVRVYALKGLST